MKVDGNIICDLCEVLLGSTHPAMDICTECLEKFDEEQRIEKIEANKKRELMQ